MEETIFGDNFQPLKRGEYVSLKEMMEAKHHHKKSLPKMKKSISWPPLLVSSVFETWSSEDYDRTKIQVDYMSLIVKQEKYDMFGPCYEGQFDVQLDFGISDGEYMDKTIKPEIQTQQTDQIFKMASVRRTKSYNSGLADFAIENYF